ncbi:MAG: YkvA family protein, partial [Longimicrobiales bacterium]
MRKRITLGRRRRRQHVARALVRELPNLFRLVFRLLRDPRVPVLNKALFGAVAVYMLTPLDLIPDFLGVLGWVDDLYLLGLALGRLMTSAGPNALLK